MVAVQGPKATALNKLEALGKRQWSNAQDICKNPLKYYFAAMSTDCSGAPRYIVSRTGYTGEIGYELIVPSSHVLEELDSLGQLFTREGIAWKPCGLGARDTLRLEAGMPLYGHELGEDIDPFQAGLSWAVKMDKGDFVGRAALQRRRQDAGSPVRVGLELEGKRIAREGCSVLCQGATVGRVTSGTFSPTLEKAIAMAYVDPKHQAIGTRCEVDVRGKTAPAQVAPLPFYRRTKS
jgi:aminomethyltransferase